MEEEIIMRIERIGREYKEEEREMIIMKDEDLKISRGEMVEIVEK